MAKIAQLGSYGKNIGDNIALQNIRNAMHQNKPKNKALTTWLDLDIERFHHRNNSIKHAKKVFEDLQENHNIDMLIIGGGGLIEDGKKFETGWKLPFNKEILDTIKVPIVVFSAGINYFYNYPELSEDTEKKVIDLYDSSSLFSLRNDGSYEIFKSFHDSDIIELPDPGLVFYHPSFNFKRKKNIKNGFFQPAWNNKFEQIVGRCFTDENIKKLNEYCSDNQLSSFCHTLKDYNFPWDHKDYVVPFDLFPLTVSEQNIYGSIILYSKYDFSIALRGHGQLIAIGVNLPSLYLSTQPKVVGFSQKNGFENYTVDIRKDNWLDELKCKTQLLKQDEKYLEDWYNLRDSKIKIYKKDMNNFCKKVWELL